MPANESLPSWRQLFQELKKHFEFVGAYLNPGSFEQAEKPFSILVGHHQPTSGAPAPYVVFRVTRDVLNSPSRDLLDLAHQGIEIAGREIGSPRSKGKNFQGTVCLEDKARFVPSDAARG